MLHHVAKAGFMWISWIAVSITHPYTVRLTKRFHSPRKTVVPSYSALSIYWKFQSDPSSLQESLQRPDRLRDTAGTVKPPSARDQTTDQVGNDQAITCGYL